MMQDIATSVQYDEEPTNVDDTDTHITQERMCLYALFENCNFLFVGWELNSFACLSPQTKEQCRNQFCQIL